jgi:tRNA threonylcarbamoyl adenosine modification protein YjeE
MRDRWRLHMQIKFKKELKRENLSEIILMLIAIIEENPSQKEWIIGVQGDLGTGKTTLFQELLKTIPKTKHSLAEEGQSPTYTYLRTYEREGFSLWHVDAYRMAPKIWEEIHAIWQEDTSESIPVIWVEWINLIESITPDILLNLKYTNDDLTRSVEISSKE